MLSRLIPVSSHSLIFSSEISSGFASSVISVDGEVEKFFQIEPNNFSKSETSSKDGVPPPK